jgi:hypothetical protein
MASNPLRVELPEHVITIRDALSRGELVEAVDIDQARVVLDALIETRQAAYHDALRQQQHREIRQAVREALASAQGPAELGGFGEIASPFPPGAANSLHSDPPEAISAIAKDFRRLSVFANSKLYAENSFSLRL